MSESSNEEDPSASSWQGNTPQRPNPFNPFAPTPPPQHFSPSYPPEIARMPFHNVENLSPFVHGYRPTLYPPPPYPPLHYAGYNGHVPPGTPTPPTRPPQLPPIHPPNASTKKSRRKPMNTSEKVEHICKSIQAIGWTFGDFLFYALETKRGSPPTPVKRAAVHAQMVGQWMKGRTAKTPAMFLTELVKSSMGIPPKDSTEREKLFSVDTDYRDSKCARPAVTTFAAQLAEEQLLKEIQRATHKDSGLHTFATGVDEVQSGNFDVNAVDITTQVLKEHMPLAFRFLENMARPRIRNRRSMARNALQTTQAKAKEKRPPELVVTFSLSSIAFCRNQNAKLLPLVKGITLLSCSANRYLWSMESRIGGSVSYNTILRLHKKLGVRDGNEVKAITKSRDRAIMIRLDNIQKYRKPRYIRTGRHAHMITGTATTAFKLESFTPGALDLDIHYRWIDKNLRKELTFDNFWESIDHSFVRSALEIQWLSILIELIPELAIYKEELARLSDTKGTKRKAKPRKSTIFPLSTTSYGETVIGELKKAIFKILEFVGITADGKKVPPSILVDRRVST